MHIQNQREPSVILGSFIDERSYAMMFTPGDHTGSDSPDKTPTSPPVPSPQLASCQNIQSPLMERGSTFAAINPIVEELQHVSEMSKENSITESHQSGDSGTSSVRVDVSSSDSSVSIVSWFVVVLVGWFVLFYFLFLFCFFGGWGGGGLVGTAQNACLLEFWFHPEVEIWWSNSLIQCRGLFTIELFFLC